jgi:hypothetical protein
LIPDVRELVSIDTYRDGGSIGASFLDAMDQHVSLFLHRIVDAGNVVTGYAAPLLQRHVPHEYTSKLDGGLLAYHTREDTPLSWEDAGRLLAAIAPMVPAVAPHDGYTFERLQRVVGLRGSLPPDA